LRHSKQCPVTSVVHVITTLDRGGAEMQLLLLAKEQLRMGVKASVLPLKGQNSLESNFISSGVRVDSSLLNKPFLWQCLRFFFTNLFFGGEVVVHAHLPRAELLVALTSRRKRSIVSKHNSEPFLSNSQTFTSFILARFVFLKTKKTICISNTVKDFLVQINELPENSDKIKIIYYGFDWTHAYPIQNLRSSNGGGGQKIRIGSIGRLVPQKDFPTLLSSVLCLKEQGFKPSLKVCGAGPDYVSLVRLTESLGLTDCITWLGVQENPFLAMGELDVFVLKSRYEGFGLVLLEAINHGIPIVASMTSAIPEVLGYDYPLLAKQGDPIDFSLKILCAVHGSKHVALMESYRNAQEVFGIHDSAVQVINTYK